MKPVGAVSVCTGFICYCQLRHVCLDTGINYWFDVVVAVLITFVQHWWQLMLWFGTCSNHQLTHSTGSDVVQVGFGIDSNWQFITALAVKLCRFGLTATGNV